MAYRQIHWLKLERRLLNDHRWYMMSEKSQLIYIKILLLAAETSNRIPKSCPILRTALRTTLDEKQIAESIIEIKENFPKFKEQKNFYYFNEWHKKHNWVDKREFPSNSPATPEQLVDKNRIDKIRTEYIRLKDWGGSTLTPTFYARTGKAIKTLLSLGSDTQVLAALKWVSEKGYCDWTCETVIKKFPDFQKHDSQPDILKRWTK